MFGHRSCEVALRGKVLLQSAESSVPTSSIPEDSKPCVIPKRGMWEGEGVVVIFESVINKGTGHKWWL